MEYPEQNVRVLVTRASGFQTVARRDYKPDSIFRSRDKLHWLDDNDKFVDVGFDRVISWEPCVPAVVIGS